MSIWLFYMWRAWPYTMNCPYDIRKQNDNSNVFLCYGCYLPLGDHHGENNLPYGKCACVKWVTIIAHQLMCGDTEGLRKLQQQAIHRDLVSDADVECMTTPQKLQWLNVRINANA